MHELGNNMCQYANMWLPFSIVKGNATIWLHENFGIVQKNVESYHRIMHDHAIPANLFSLKNLSLKIIWFFNGEGYFSIKF